MSRHCRYNNNVYLVRFLASARASNIITAIGLSGGRNSRAVRMYKYARIVVGAQYLELNKKKTDEFKL